MINFESLFKSYFARLCVFAYPLVKSEDIAKDMVQDAFIVLSQNPDIQEKSEEVIKSFLYSTVRNICLNYLRREKLGIKINERIPFEEIDDSNQLELLIKSEVIGELYQEISNLPDKCQHVCKLIYLEGKSYEETAAILQVSINTVKTQRQRALNYLKSKFLNFILLIISVLLIF